MATTTHNDEWTVRIPFTNKTVRVTNPTFPGNSSEYRDTNPAVVAYFDQKNANTQLAGAAGPVFPANSDEMTTSPAIIVHFDRLEAQRIAALKAEEARLAAQQAAREAATAAATAAPQSTANEPPGGG